MRRRDERSLLRARVATTLACALALLGANLFGAEDESRRERAERKIEQRLEEIPWYSPDAKSAKYLPIKPEPEKIIVETPPKAEKKPQQPVDLSFLLKAFAVVFLIALLALLAYYATLWRKRGAQKVRLDEQEARRRRVETLAEEARDFYDDLKGAAEAARARGDYRSATIFLFSWILVELDKRNFVLLDPGKTNMEYWRELASRPDLRAWYRTAMTTFEITYFGGREISRKEFDALWEITSPFEAAMQAEDALRAAREEQRLAAQRRADAAAWRQNSATPRMLFVGALVASSFFAAGCRKDSQEYWNRSYDLPASYNVKHSLDGVSIFEDCCASATSSKVVANQVVDLDDTDADAIVYLAAPQFVSSAVVNVVAPSDPNAKDAERAAARAKMRRRYAECDPEKDWSDFFLPSCNRFLLAPNSSHSRNANSYYFADSEAATRKDVEEWLAAKPNRVFVYILSEWSAKEDYLEAASKWIETDAPEKDRESFREEARKLREELATTPRFEADKIGTRVLSRMKLVAADDRQWENGETSVNDGDDSDPIIPLEALTNIPFSNKYLNEASDAFFKKSVYDAIGVDFGDDWDPEFLRQKSVDDAKLPPSPDDLWLRAKFLDPKRTDASDRAPFTGDPDWLKVLPPTGTLNETQTLEPLNGTEVLLALDGVPLVCRRRVGESVALFVNSTSFLSNYALIDPTNRAIAERLAFELPQRGRIEFALDGIVKPERSRRTYSFGDFSLTKFTPFTVMTWHAFLAAVALTLASWPIFGRPKRTIFERNTDFSRHVDAVAQLLKSRNCVDWAREQIDACRRARGVLSLRDDDALNPTERAANPYDQDASNSRDA